MTARLLDAGPSVAIDEAILDQGVLGLGGARSKAVGVPDGVEAAVQLRRADIGVTARRWCQDLREAGRRARGGSGREREQSHGCDRQAGKDPAHGPRERRSVRITITTASATSSPPKMAMSSTLGNPLDAGSAAAGAAGPGDDLAVSGHCDLGIVKAGAALYGRVA